MIRTLVGVLVIVFAPFTLASDPEHMWVCHVGATPGNAIVLVSSGSRSYVKLSGHRVPAELTEEDGTQRWSWGTNSIALDDSGVAQYYEGADSDSPKSTFRCRLLR